MAFLLSFETVGTFVRQGILNEALVRDLYDLSAGWRHIEKIVKALRREEGQPRILENAEWLAGRDS
jgi:hypothetical protein